VVSLLGQHNAWFCTGRCTAIATIALVSAASAWTIGAGTALAPEPARLTAPLNGPTGATAAAVFISAPKPVGYVLMPTSFGSYSNPPIPGTPCSNSVLAPGIRTDRIVQSPGTMASPSNYRRCYVGKPYLSEEGPAPAYRSTYAINDTQVFMLDARGTTVVKWPRKWRTRNRPPDAGTPCTPKDLKAEETTSMVIEAAPPPSTYRRCVKPTAP
jgi:hypothetical protein